MFTQKILLIDDDEITLELLQHILEEFVSGEIVSISSSIKALEVVQALQPGELGLIICDWQMPDYDGIAVLTALRKIDTQTPFLMLTGNATRDLVLAAKKAGATDFIAKPFRNQELTLKIQRLLENQ